MATEAQLRAIRKYDDKNTIKINMKLNKRTDADILRRLDEMSRMPGGKQGYIKELIRRDMGSR